MSWTMDDLYEVETCEELETQVTRYQKEYIDSNEHEIISRRWKHANLLDKL